MMELTPAFTRWPAALCRAGRRWMLCLACLGTLGGGAATGSGHPAFFANEVLVNNGVYYLVLPGGGVFGYYSYLSDPDYLYSFDLGYEYLFDANDGKSGVYFYDFASNTYFYTSPSFSYPYLYDFTLDAVLYYYPGTTHPRYFYDYSTGEVITK